MVHDRTAAYPVSLTRSDRLLLHLLLPMQLLVAVPADDSKPPFVAVHNPSKLPAFTLASLPDAHLSLIRSSSRRSQSSNSLSLHEDLTRVRS
jgi:hypothetical protein